MPGCSEVTSGDNDLRYVRTVRTLERPGGWPNPFVEVVDPQDAVVEWIIEPDGRLLLNRTGEGQFKENKTTKRRKGHGG